MAAMIVTLYGFEQSRATVLPEKVSGRFDLYELVDGKRLELAQIEGDGTVWRMYTRPDVCRVRLDGRPCNEVQLQENSFYTLLSSDGQECARVHVEPSDIRRGTFSKYVLQGDCVLTLGREEDNGIILHSGYVSKHHAKLAWQGGRWFLEDCSSRNGTYVNDRRCTSAELFPGDTVFIAGVKLIAGKGFFALNNPNGIVEIREHRVSPLVMPEPARTRGHSEVPRSDLFYRAPRFRRTLQRKSLSVDQPPTQEQISETPAILVAGPAMTMGLTGAVMAFSGIMNYAIGTATLLNTIPTMVMSFSMLCATVLWPALTRRSDKKRKQEAERRRTETYRAYLDRVQDEIIGIQVEQQSVLEENYPGPEQWFARVQSRAPELWERSPDQPDFLSVRAGAGKRPLELDLQGQAPRFSVRQDYLADDMRRIVSLPHELDGAPITWSLLEHPVTGVVGDPDEIASFMRLLALQIAVFHSYTDVKLILLSDDAQVWSEAKWLPHTWDDSLRMTAHDRADRKYLSACLEKVLTQRQQARSSARERELPLPCYVVLSVGREALSAFDVADSLCAGGGTDGFFLVAAAERRSDLPKECSKVVDLREKSLVSPGGEGQAAFQRDHMEEDQYSAACRGLANIRLDIRGQYELPDSISFLEMYRTDKVEHLNVRDRWRQNNPVNSLQVPVGVGTDGETFTLDLHEKVHGPHGLVAGMTGSGKSEFVISLVLSLAANFAPDEVAFILIDYKGGGLTGAFENPDTGVRLPHLAGTITNLDGAEINRSLVSIESELRRRQAAFQRARQATDSGTIDIYKYQQFYRSGQVSEPMPHLFIISDEFAELKSQQPEFMDQLVSTARIGRSLGVHLILATQKPAGVVDDQIWSNSRFRVCLKVQDKSDSMDMIKRPDAAELRETGRFYLQVGFNEYFAKGQSAWSGAPYIPGEGASKKRDDGAAVLDSLGRTSSEAYPAGRQVRADTTQVVSIVKYLSDIARTDGIRARPLWVPPLRKKIVLDALREKYGFQRPAGGLAAAAGELDAPANQRQELLTVDLSGDGNLLIFGNMGSGKTTLLSTILCSLLEDYTAQELNVYIIDLAAESLQAFERAPQVGGVAVSGETERVENLFKLLTEEMDRRRKIFAGYGGDYSTYCAQGGEHLPRILVVLHNYAVFSEQFEGLEDTAMRLARDGEKYGLHFIVTAQASNSIRYRLMQAFKQVLTLQFMDPVEYSILLGSSKGVVPGKTPGRGLVKRDGIYEYQAALPTPNGTVEELRAFCSGLETRGAGRARPIPVLPEQVDLDYVRHALTGLAHIPVGVAKRDLSIAAMNCETALISLILAQESAALPGTVRAVTAAIASLDGVDVTVFDGDDLFDGAQEDGYTCIRSGFEPHVMDLSMEMVRRNNTYKASVREGTPPPAFQDRVYVLTGTSKLLSMLSAQGKDHLETLLEKAELHYRVRFILCDTAQDLSGLALAPWFKQGVDQSTGLWIGSGITEQSVLRLNRITSGLYGELKDTFGYALLRGKPTLVKVLQEREDEV